MRLFRLELKRILKSRRTLILLAIALLLSVAMAYLPISFEGINRPNEDGTVTELDGLAAIKYKQDLYKTSAGEVTPDRIKSALETYQSCVREYGPVEEEGFPLAVFIEKIVPFRHLLMGLSEAFADPVTGIGADLMDIDPNDIDGAYYEKCAEHLQDVMRNEQRENETAQQKALEKYSELDTPFYLHSGISKDAFDYIELYILLLATTIYLWLISLTTSKELSILLLKLYNDGAIGISNTFLDSASVIKTDNQLLIRSVRFMQVESP